MIFSPNITVQTWTFGGKEARVKFLFDGAVPPEKVGCRKESYFLEFMHVDVAKDLLLLLLLLLLLFCGNLRSKRTILLNTTKTILCC